MRKLKIPLVGSHASVLASAMPAPPEHEARFGRAKWLRAQRTSTPHPTRVPRWGRGGLCHGVSVQGTEGSGKESPSHPAGATVRRSHGCLGFRELGGFHHTQPCPDMPARGLPWLRTGLSPSLRGWTVTLGGSLSSSQGDSSPRARKMWPGANEERARFEPLGL